MKRYLLFVMLCVCASIGAWAGQDVTINTNGDEDYSNWGWTNYDNLGWGCPTSVTVIGKINQTGLDKINAKVATNSDNNNVVPLNLSQATLNANVTTIGSCFNRVVLPPGTDVTSYSYDNPNLKYAISIGNPTYIEVSDGVTLAEITDLTSSVLDDIKNNNKNVILSGEGANALKSELVAAGLSDSQVSAPTVSSDPVEITVASPVTAASVQAAIEALADAPAGASAKNVTVLHVTGTLTDDDVSYIKSLTKLKLLDLSAATGTKEQIAACVKDGDYNAKDIALIIPTPNTNDYSQGMEDIFYYQTCCGSGTGLKNVSFYENTINTSGALTTTQNLKVWGANRTLLNLKLAQAPQIIKNTMGISFLPNYTSNGDLNWSSSDFSVYPNVDNKNDSGTEEDSYFVSNVLSQLNCLSIDMMWLNHASLKYDFSGLNKETHYIVIPQNSAQYAASNDIDDTVTGSDYNYGTCSDTEGIWVVGTYAGTQHPYSRGVSYQGHLHNTTEAHFAETTNITYIRKAGKLLGAEGTLTDLQKHATRMVIFGQANTSDLQAMQHVASTKIDLSTLNLVEGASITGFTNSSVVYLALPQSGSVSEFVPSAIKGRCTALKGLGMYHVAEAGEDYNTLYYSSWNAAGEAYIVTGMMPELAGTSGVRAYKMWGPLNQDDICATNNHVNGAFPTTQHIFSADLSMAWFPNQEDMVLTDNGTYGATNFEKCSLPRTNMTMIPEGAFEGRVGLTYMAIPDIYTAIKANAFNGTSITQMDTYDITTTGESDVAGKIYGSTGHENVYCYTYDKALVKDIISNGPLTLTLPASLGNNKANGEGIYEGAMWVPTTVKEVYVLATEAPYCQKDAFGSCAYVCNNTFAGVQETPFGRDKYLKDATQWMAVLHFPSACTDAQRQKYTDVTREYSLIDGTGEVDGDGKPLAWPNQAEYLRAYDQAINGVTWQAWDTTRDGQNSLEYGTYNTPTPDLVTNASAKYDVENYCGWHQFVLAANWMYIPAIPDDEPVTINYVKTDWYTLCIPYNMSKKQVVKLLGIPASAGVVTRKLDGATVESDMLPEIRTLTGVTRYPNTEIMLHISQNIAEKDKDIKVSLRGAEYTAERGYIKNQNDETLSGEDNQIYIRGGYPYLVKAYLPEDYINDVKNLGGFVLARGEFLEKNVGNTYPSHDYDWQAPFELKVQAFAKKGTEDAYPIQKDGTKDEKAPGVNENAYIYTFVGQYWEQPLPLYSYYLGNSSSGKKFYRATAPMADSKKWSKWTWSPYVAIVTAKGTNTVTEPLFVDGKGYMKSLSMQFDANDDSFGAAEAKFCFMFEDGIMEWNGEDDVTSVRTLDGVVDIPMKTRVYSLDGQYCGDSLQGLPKGLYIVNGKKYIVK